MADLQSFINDYSPALIDIMGGILIVAVIIALIDIIRALITAMRKKPF